MKGIITILALAAVLTGCKNTPTFYHVKGMVPDSLNGKNVSLYAYEIKNKKIATTVVENGRFELTDTLHKPVVARVKIDGDSKEEYGCVLDEVPVVINYDDKGIHVTGSHRTAAMVEYDNMGEERRRNLRNTNVPNSLAMVLSGKKREYTEEERRELEEVAKHNASVEATYYHQLKELVKRNTDNVVGAYVFSWLYDGNGIDEETELQDSIMAVAGKEFLETPMVERMIAAHNQRVGQTYTDIELPDRNGKMHKLSDIVGEGKYVLVDVWASWCVGCRIETPHVKDAFAKYHDRGFEVVMISIDVDDNDVKWLQAMEKDGITDMGYQWIDRDSKIRKLYGIGSIPCSMLIGPDGKIVANNLRDDDLENILSKVIGE